MSSTDYHSLYLTAILCLLKKSVLNIKDTELFVLPSQPYFVVELFSFRLVRCFNLIDGLQSSWYQGKEIWSSFKLVSGLEGYYTAPSQGEGKNTLTSSYFKNTEIRLQVIFQMGHTLFHRHPNNSTCINQVKRMLEYLLEVWKTTNCSSINMFFAEDLRPPGL